MQCTDIPRVEMIGKAAAMQQLVQSLGNVPDPRTARRPVHSLTNILAIALCAVVADCDSWEDMEDFGHERQAWFETFLSLPHGIPSRDTFRRVFARLKPRPFQQVLVAFIESLREPTPDDEGADDQHFAIDGKTLRSSFDRATEQSSLHLVEAMDTGTQLIVAQAPTHTNGDEEVKRGNEITAIPQVLELLDLHGAVVTIDAIGCQTKIAAQIVAGGGDYLLALKDNHPTLHRQVLEYFLKLHAEPLPSDASTLETNEPRARGRSEERYYTAAPLPAGLFGQHNWAGLQSLVQTTTTIMHADKTTIDSRYFLSSLPTSEIEKIARCTRRHWWIEATHWVLDVTFGEDASRVHQGHAAENLATLRRGALGLLKAYQNKPVHFRKKRPPSLKSLRKQAGRSTTILANIVTQRT
jgi:predicted transposase YbfD/YdcC